MYDVNPLGPMMHLKELERQAMAAARGPHQSRSSIIALLRARLAILLRLSSGLAGIARHKEI
jgi:hypothetical protein